MMKRYKTLSGIKGILAGDRIIEIEPEYQESLLDLAEANAVYPDTFKAVISNLEEFNEARDAVWYKRFGIDPSDPLAMPFYTHPPSMMSTAQPLHRPCTTVQIGTQLFHFDEPQDFVFDLVVKEKSSAQ